MGVRALVEGVLNLAYPRECMGCGVRLTRPPPVCLCEQCLAAVVRVGPEQCPRCGGHMGPFAEGRLACASCGGRDDVAFSKGTAVFNYDTVTRRVIHGFKFGGDLSPVAWIGRELSAKLGRTAWLAEVDIVVPVPLHWTRRLARRFNQSELIARGICSAHALPLAACALRRIRKTAPQSMLDPAERRQNVRGAFRVVHRRAVAGKCALVVDDVMSTCSTASECARALKHAGARRVFVAVFAR